MNREMVTYSLGRAPKKIREKDGDIDYEEWIYGEPPKDVHFIRLVGDEVIRVEVMKVNGEKVVRTEKEVDLGDGPTLAKSKDEPEIRPANAPSLRRPGEDADHDPRSDGSIVPLRGWALTLLQPIRGKHASTALQWRSECAEFRELLELAVTVWKRDLSRQTGQAPSPHVSFLAFRHLASFPGSP